MMPNEMSPNELADWVASQNDRNSDMWNEVETRLRAMSGMIPRPVVELHWNSATITNNRTGEKIDTISMRILLNGLHLHIPQYYSQEESAMAGFDAEQINTALGMKWGGE